MSPSKEEVTSVVDTHLSPQQINLQNVQQIEDRFDEGYDNDGEPGPLCDM